MKKLELIADKIIVRGPKIDGGYSVTFELGEYMQQKVAEILKIPQQTEVKIIVSTGGKDE